MMETILNLGLNDVTVEGLTRQSDNPQFAWDSYRRFVQMYGSVVFDLSKKPFEHLLEEAPATLRGRARHRSAAGGRAGAGAAVQGAGPDGDRPRVPRRSGAAAVGRHRGGVRELEHPAGDRLPEAARHPRHHGHRGQHRGDGLRQPGRGLRHRRDLQPRPVHRRPVRCTASSCSTPRARTWSPAAGRRCPSPPFGRSCPTPTRSWSASPARWSGTSATCRTWSSPSSAACSTCCRPGGASARVRPRCRSPATWWTRA